jgi:hypothetical protein
MNMENKYAALVAKATELTDEQFRDRLSSLTRLNTEDVEDILAWTGTDKETLAALLTEIENAWMYNEYEAEAIQRIGKSINVLVALLKKLL